MKFVAIDVETANAQRASICAVGVVVFEDGQVIETMYYRLNPKTEFLPINISIHGITPDIVRNAPEFHQIAPQLRAMIEGQVVVSHTEFDLQALEKALARYELPAIYFEHIDSYDVAKEAWPQLSNHKLPTVAKHLGIEFNHHHALEDARAAGEIYIKSRFTNSAQPVAASNPKPIKPRKNIKASGEDKASYHQFTTKSRLDKAVNSLLGILEGVAIDGMVNNLEVRYLLKWLNENQEFAQQHPFNEILPHIAEAMTTGMMREETHEEITWLAEKFRSGEYYSAVTGDMQRLHAMLAAIASDGQITETELINLSDWLEEHDHLRTIWPYEEVESLITDVLKDKRVDQAENARLLHYFSEFSETELPVVIPHIDHPQVQGLCAVAPSITFEGSTFCFTGEFTNHSREGLLDLVQERGGIPSKSVTKSTKYLVIGSEGNPCWAYACYGRKVEKAIELRKQGQPLLLVHEVDFIDAL